MAWINSISNHIVSQKKINQMEVISFRVEDFTIEMNRKMILAVSLIKLRLELKTLRTILKLAEITNVIS